jgi:hypothetical protein
MDTFTIEVAIPENLRERFEARVRARGGDHASYVREVVERDLQADAPHAGMTFKEIFASSQEGFDTTGTSDDELSEFIEAEVKQYRAERRARESRGG